MSRAATDRYQRQLLELAKAPGNDQCADCQSRNPRWASWDHGVFLCERCAGLHRRMGTHVSKIKSLTHDNWSKEQVEGMRAKGNIVTNSVLNPNVYRHPPPTTSSESDRDGQLEQFIRNKYEHRAFVDRAPSGSLGPPFNAPSFASPAGRVPTPSPATATRPPPAPAAAQPAPLSTAAFSDLFSAQPQPRSATAPPPASAFPSIEELAARPASAYPAVKRVRFNPPESIPSDDDDDEPPPRHPSRMRPAKGILRPRSSRGQVWPGEGGREYCPKPPVEWIEEGMDNDGTLAPQPLTPQGTGWSQAPQAGFAPQGAFAVAQSQQQQQQQQAAALGAGGMFGGLGGGASQGGAVPPLTAQGTGFPRTGSPFAPIPQPLKPGHTGGPTWNTPQHQQQQQQPQHQLPTSTGSSLMPPSSAPAPLTHQLTGWTNRGPSPIPPTFEQGGSFQGASFLNPTPNGAPPIGAHNAPGTSGNAPQYGRGPSPGPFNVHPGQSPSPSLPPLTAQGTGYPGARTASPNAFLFSQASATQNAQSLAPQPTGFGRTTSPGPFDTAPALPPRPGASPLSQQPTGYQRQPSPFAGGSSGLTPQATGYGGSFGGGSSIGMGLPSTASFNGGQRDFSGASTSSNLSAASFASNGSYNPFAASMQQGGSQQQQPNQSYQQPNQYGQQQQQQQQQITRKSSSIWDDLADLSTPTQTPGFQSTSAFNDSPFDFGPTQQQQQHTSTFRPSASVLSNASGGSSSFLSSQPTGAGSFLGSSQASHNGSSFLGSSQNSQISSTGSFLSSSSAASGGGRVPGKAFVPSSAFGQELAKEHGLGGHLGGGGGGGGAGAGGGRFTPSPGPFTPTQHNPAGAGVGGSYFGAGGGGGPNGMGQANSGGGSQQGTNPFFGIGGMASSLPSVQQNPFDFGGQQGQRQGQPGFQQAQPTGFQGGSFYGQQPQQQQQQQQGGNPFDFF